MENVMEDIMENITEDKKDFYVNHEIRISMLEKDLKDIKGLLKLILGVTLTAVIVPLIRDYFGIH